ncbi:hypothetical protein [Nostoc sp.]|uniref:hypothetical protein n=1 Tax=Nostoc sp. TaxID=1180 RepID=UPI00359367BE
MFALTLAQLFGDGANQTATELVIRKTDLAAVGMTATANNRAEQLVIAMLLKALENFQGHLTDENGNPITDENNSPIEYDNSQLYELLEIFRWPVYIPDGDTGVIRNQFVIQSYTLYKIDDSD